MSRTQRIWVVTLGTVLHVLASLCLIGAVAGAVRQEPKQPAPSPTTTRTTVTPSTAAVTSRPVTSVAPPTTTAAPVVTSAPPPPPPPPPPQQLDPRFATCADAKANGYGPYYRGQDPEYAWYRDGDNDGIACE